MDQPWTRESAAIYVDRWCRATGAAYCENSLMIDGYELRFSAQVRTVEVSGRIQVSLTAGSDVEIKVDGLG